MKDIPAGTFTMGSDSLLDAGAQPPHQVTLSAFKMSETDVTQEQYQAVMDTNPSFFNTGTGASLRPVESVTWYNAAQFCNALSALSGLASVYDTSTWTADFSKTGYRLPTEAQWEFACRAGSTTEYWWGSDTNGMGARTWSIYNSGLTTHPVATKLANAYGMYDMT
jgi:formylglycine-generating enzyme required for sulfatase activity